jgi:hypothetical protein
LPVPAVGGAGGGNVTDVPWKDVTPKPGIGARIGQFAKNIASKVTGKVAAGAAAVAAIGAGAYGAYQGLKKLFADPNIQMDPADKAQFEKHMAVIDKYAKDAEAAGALPADVQKRLTAVAQRVQKIAGKVQAAPAAPGAPAAPVAPK